MTRTSTRAPGASLLLRLLFAANAMALVLGGVFAIPAAALETTANSITLSWTAPGDDGTEGVASTYDIRYSTSVISESNWSQATSCPNEPAPVSAGTKQSHTIDGLQSNTTYYVAMRTADEVPNWSVLSNVVQVKTDPAPVTTGFAANTTSGTTPLTVQFTDQSTGDITFRQWSFGDGTTSSTANPQHTYQSSGTYTVRLIAGNSQMADTLIKSNYITVSDPLAPPSAAFTVSDTLGEAPLTVQFTDQSTGDIASRQWTFGDGATSTSANPQHTYQSSGTYTVRLIVSNAESADTLIKTDYITATQPTTPPVADFVVSDTIGVAPMTVQFTNQSTGDITYQEWDFGDGTISLSANPEHTYNLPGTFSVRLIVGNDQTADTLLKVGVIEVKSLATEVTADFSATPTSGDAPLAVQFTDMSAGNPTGWQWSFGDGAGSLSQNPSHTYDSAGSFTVRLIVTDGNTVDTLVRSNLISVGAPPPPSLTRVYANAETLKHGLISGTLGATQASDNQYEVITEIESGGKPEFRYSLADHVWTFDVPSDPTVTFFAEAHRNANSDGDDFSFEYSTNGTDFVSLTTVTSTTDAVISSTVPGFTGGTLYIRAVDTDRSEGHNSLDNLYVDELYLELGGDPLPPDTLHVANLTVTNDGGRGVWFTATAEITVRNQRQEPVTGVTVTGHFDGPSTGVYSVQTSSDGVATVQSDRVKYAEGQWTFTIDALSAPGYVYASADNAVTTATSKVLALPNVAELYQNYPNPFNPTTEISFWMPQPGHARLSVYNLIGQEIDVLHDGNLEAGNHAVTWDAGENASGVYFYRLETVDRVETRKMVIVK